MARCAGRAAALQILGGQVQRRSASTAGPVPAAAWLRPPRQLLGGLFDPDPSTRPPDRPRVQHLNAGDRGVERGRELGLRIHRLQAGADHRHAGSGQRGGGGGQRHPGPAGKGGQPGIGQFHLARQAAKAARPAAPTPSSSARTWRPPSATRRTD
jgi:hypothetical protein